MNRTEKEELVKHWHEAFASVQGAVFTGVSRLTVAQSTELRRRFKAAGVKYEVVKNSLARIALKGTAMDIAVGHVDGPTGVAWSDKDPIAPAKVASDFIKETDKFELRGGYATGQKLDKEGVKALASMPSMEELRARLLGTINGVAAKLLAQVSAPAQQITGVLQARKDDLEKKQAA